MKRISPGTVTIGVIGVLLGLLTVCAANHFFGGSPTEGPETQTPAEITDGLPHMPAAPGCRDSQKEHRASALPEAPAIRPGALGRNVPTLAPPQSTPSLAAGVRSEPGSRGEVIYVQVEAEGIGLGGN